MVLKMNVRRETPSLFEQCDQHNKSKDQEVASSLNDCLESKSSSAYRRLCSIKSCSVEAYESNVSVVEIRKKCFPYVANRNELRFSCVETHPSLVLYDSYDSDTESSSEEDCDTLAGWFQAQNGYVRTNNPQAARLDDELKNQAQREMFREIRHRGLKNSFPPRVGEQSQYYFQKQTKTQGYSYSQANRQSCPRYHHDPLPLLARRTIHDTVKSTPSIERRQKPQGSHNKSKKTEIKLPPIQPLNDRPRDMKSLPPRKTGRQEMCEAKKQWRPRREGVCLATESAREERIFMRVLGKRF